MADYRTAIERAIKSREDKKEDYVLRKDRAITIYVISVQFAFKAFTINRERGLGWMFHQFPKKRWPKYIFRRCNKTFSWQVYLEFELCANILNGTTAALNDEIIFEIRNIVIKLCQCINVKLEF